MLRTRVLRAKYTDTNVRCTLGTQGAEETLQHVILESTGLQPKHWPFWRLVNTRLIGSTSRSCDVIHLEVAAAWGRNGWALVQDVSLLMQPADSKPDEQSGGFQPQKDYLTGSQENRQVET
ncbi:hypothetical protein HPB47_025737 [Ixodes persulcatus]|uniref:Uncharacterized protein n=1 Tax=Ixodes persulcatus TaxID=34615 RepID=A0AC60Q354_IXOPE|nr:hypothetical protein HPB47_025737 [Ixodes persulcatus]